MLRIKNKTPFKATISLQTDLQGHDMVCAYFSSSFYFFEGQWFVSDGQMPSPMSDQFWDTKRTSSIRYPSQLSFNKSGTDVIINAEAVFPGGVPVGVLPIDILVGKLRTSLLVFGDRIWQDGYITSPRLFSRIPIIWENAFGGQAVFENTELAHNEKTVIPHEHNPLGMGWTHPKKHIQNGTRLPNIEWRNEYIRSPKDTPLPAGIGALGPESPLRSVHAGTYDETWSLHRCPYAPDDFNPDFLGLPWRTFVTMGLCKVMNRFGLKIFTQLKIYHLRYLMLGHLEHLL